MNPFKDWDDMIVELLGGYQVKFEFEDDPGVRAYIERCQVWKRLPDGYTVMYGTKHTIPYKTLTYFSEWKREWVTTSIVDEYELKKNRERSFDYARRECEKRIREITSTPDGERYARAGGILEDE